MRPAQPARHSRVFACRATESHSDKREELIPGSFQLATADDDDVLPVCDPRGHGFRVFGNVLRRMAQARGEKTTGDSFEPDRPELSYLLPSNSSTRSRGGQR